MSVFSERYGFAPEKEIQIDDIDLELFNRLWNIVYSHEYDCDMFNLGAGCLRKTENLLDYFGYTYEYPSGSFEHNQNVDKLKNIMIDKEWYIIYDLIEKFVDLFDNSSEKKKIEKDINFVLEQQKSGYRMVKGLITPITNSSELDSIKKSMSTKFKAVNTHFEKALKLYSNRKNPDYENSIKESISAVESICCIITETTGKQATLGAALKKLEDNGIHIHGALKQSFLSLYGYTSDEDGIRHGGIEFNNAPAEDAKYMLVSCSAFVNYLIEKWSKVNA